MTRTARTADLVPAPAQNEANSALDNVLDFPRAESAPPVKPEVDVDHSRGINICPVCQGKIPQRKRGAARKTCGAECKLIQDTVARMEKLLDSADFKAQFDGMSASARNEFWYRVQALSTRVPRQQRKGGGFMPRAGSDRSLAKSERRRNLRRVHAHLIEVAVPRTRREICAALRMRWNSCESLLSELVDTGKVVRIDGETVSYEAR